MMRRTLDMTSLDRLNHMLGCIDDVEELRRRPDHPNNIYNQSPSLPLHMGEGEGEAEAEGVIHFHVH